MGDTLIQYNDPVQTGISVLGKLPGVVVLPSTGSGNLVEFTSSNSGTRTFGFSDASKIAIVAIGFLRSTGVSSITIDGNAMTLVSAPTVTSGTTTIGTAIAYRAFTGTSATVAITLSSSLGIANANFFSAISGSSIQDTLGVSSTAATISGSLDVAKEGGAIAVVMADASGNAFTWTNMTEVNDRAVAGTLARFGDAIINNSSVTALSTITVSADTTVSDVKSLTAISFSVP